MGLSHQRERNVLSMQKTNNLQDLFLTRLQTATPDEAATLRAAAAILGLDL